MMTDWEWTTKASPKFQGMDDIEDRARQLAEYDRIDIWLSFTSPVGRFVESVRRLPCLGGMKDVGVSLGV
jgi:hypothetical protein